MSHQNKNARRNKARKAAGAIRNTAKRSAGKLKMAADIARAKEVAESAKIDGQMKEGLK